MIKSGLTQFRIRQKWFAEVFLVWEYSRPYEGCVSLFLSDIFTETNMGNRDKYCKVIAMYNAFDRWGNFIRDVIDGYVK